MNMQKKIILIHLLVVIKKNTQLEHLQISDKNHIFVHFIIAQDIFLSKHQKK